MKLNHLLMNRQVMRVIPLLNGSPRPGELPCLRRKTVHFRGALAPLSLALQRADAAFQHRYMQHVDAYISRLPSPEQTGKAERSPQARSFIIFRCGHHLVLRPRWSASFGAAVGGVNICIAWVGAYPKVGSPSACGTGQAARQDLFPACPWLPLAAPQQGREQYYRRSRVHRIRAQSMYCVLSPLGQTPATCALPPSPCALACRIHASGQALVQRQMVQVACAVCSAWGYLPWRCRKRV